MGILEKWISRDIQIWQHWYCSIGSNENKIQWWIYIVKFWTRPPPLPGGQILSISCSFWGNLAKSYVGAPLENWRPLLGEILDPPLKIELVNNFNTKWKSSWHIDYILLWLTTNIPKSVNNIKSQLCILWEKLNESFILKSSNSSQYLWLSVMCIQLLTWLTCSEDDVCFPSVKVAYSKYDHINTHTHTHTHTHITQRMQASP